MIYRILHDDQYLTFEISTGEVLSKLGRSHPFHIDRTPIAYTPFWKSSLEISFRPPGDDTLDIIPNLAEVDGKLYLDVVAFDILKDVLKNNGEFLPVIHDETKGYIFNILTIAEERGGLDEQFTKNDIYGNLESLAFIDEIMARSPIFRTKIDGYQGIFCNEAIKEIIEKNSLHGIIFQTDLSSPVI